MRRGKNFELDDDGYDPQKTLKDFIGYLGPALTAYGAVKEEKVRFETLERQLQSLPETPVVPHHINLQRIERAHHPDERERITKELYQQAHRLASRIVDFRHSFPSCFVKPVESELYNLEERCRYYIPDSVRHYETMASRRKRIG